MNLFFLSIILIMLVNNYNNGTINYLKYLLFTISFIMGNIIWYCIDFMIHCLSFWFRNFSYAGWLAGELTKYSRRPDSIYKNFFRKTLFTIFPMAMISSVPARFLIFGSDLKLLLLQIVVTIIFLWFTTLIWKKGLLRYESASS